MCFGEILENLRASSSFFSSVLSNLPHSRINSPFRFKKKRKTATVNPGRQVALRLQQDVPATNLLSSTLLHVLPVELLLLAAAVLPQSEPADHLFALHAAPVVDGDQQRDVRQLEERHLEDEGLLVDGVGLAATHRRLAPRDLLTDRVQQRQTPVGVWRGNGGKEKYTNVNAVPFRVFYFFSCRVANQ